MEVCFAFFQCYWCNFNSLGGSTDTSLAFRSCFSSLFVGKCFCYLFYKIYACLRTNTFSFLKKKLNNSKNKRFCFFKIIPFLSHHIKFLDYLNFKMETLVRKTTLNKLLQSLLIGFSFVFGSLGFFVTESKAYPVYAQQGYSNPRAANGKIACANCHLAEKPVEIESPQAVLPDSVFEAIVKIPYDKSLKQIQGNGKLGSLNVGAVVVLPEGFKLAPNNRLTKEIKEKNKGVYISPYSSTQENILVVGPIGGDLHQEISFPIVAPNP